MRIKFGAFLITILFLYSCSSTSNDEMPVLTNQKAKIVGYLPVYNFSVSNKIEYCKLTHLNLSFANPDSEGNIIMANVNEVMADAVSDNPNIVIFISLAGGALTSEQAINWSNLIDIPANRPAFINKIVEYVVLNNFDGVDLDLEWSHVTSGYSDFAVELDAALTAKNKLFSAALPCLTLFPNINAKALQAFDFINIMAYDATGPWRPAESGQHSSFEFAKSGIDFWKKTVGIDASKLTLGVPFYGYTFNSSTSANSFKYADMVLLNNSNADVDKLGNSFYNGRPTIKRKVDLASKEVGGIMIWQLAQDSFDQYSLLKTIHEKYSNLGVRTTELCGN